jgi:hypothetical protein
MPGRDFVKKITKKIWKKVLTSAFWFDIIYL